MPLTPIRNQSARDGSIRDCSYAVIVNGQNVYLLFITKIGKLPPMPPRPQSRGSSIIDLIFVIACVGLLMAVMQPSLQSALQLSRKSICLDRLHSIGQASIIYSNNDPNDMAIPVHPAHNDPQMPNMQRYIGPYEWGGKSGIGWQEFLWGNDPIFSAYGTLAGFGPATRPLNAVLYQGGFVNYAPDGANENYDRLGAQRDQVLNADIFRCPADDGPPLGAHCQDWINHPLQSSYDYFGTSFAANLFDVGTAGGGPVYSNAPYLHQLSEIQNPGRTIMYEENIGRWAWAAKNELPDCVFLGPGVDPGPTKAVRGWHGKNWMYTRAFSDAHAEFQALYIEGTEDVGGYANHYRREYVDGLPQWPDNPLPSGNDELNDQYRCIIVRGDGWQKDTFPAPVIPTGRTFSGPSRPSYEYCVQPGDQLHESGG